jgi:hypothetical protein
MAAAKHHSMRRRLNLPPMLHGDVRMAPLRASNHASLKNATDGARARRQFWMNDWLQPARTDTL